ncbi:MAG TPA: SMI1/KNR4 family protein [Abditibacteriaceae bacterium]|jgi:hypothetical protein
MQDYESQIKNILDRLRSTGTKIPAVPCIYQLKEPVFGTGSPQADIVSLEDAIKAPLPQDFVAFQELCGTISAMDIWNGYSIMGASHIKSLFADTQLLHVFHTDSQSIMMPIGSDGGGNMFLMGFVGGNQILKWNHETDSQEKLADSFTEFLERMLEDWEHFVIQDANWKYMSV